MRFYLPGTEKLSQKKSAAVIAGIFAFILMIPSDSAPWSRTGAVSDSTVYLYNASLMLQGGRPYVDFFDHKGILMYFINMLGLLINRRWGIWLVEIAFLTLDIFIAYQTMRLWFDVRTSAIGTALSFLFLYENPSTFSSGNKPEEYVLLPVLISLYLFSRALKENRDISGREALIHGICCMSVILIKLNLVVLWAVFCTYFLIRAFRQKKTGTAFGYLGMFLAGCLIPFIPSVLYLYTKGALNACIQDYLVFNLAYSSGHHVSDLWDMILEHLNVLFLFSVCGTVLVFARRKLFSKEFMEAFILSTVCLGLHVAMVFTTFNAYGYYLISYIPFLLYSLSTGLYLRKQVGSQKRRLLRYVLITAIALLVCYYSVNLYYSVSISEDSEAKQRIISMIQVNTDDDDTILSEGAGQIVDWIYNDSERKCCSRYSFTPIPMTEQMVTEYRSDVQNCPPSLLILWCNPKDSITLAVYPDRYQKIGEDSLLECTFWKRISKGE